MGIQFVADETRTTTSSLERTKDDRQSDQVRTREGDRAWSTNLPLQPTPFIGREAELAAIAELVTRVPAGGQAQGSCQLLTLVGPGGVGKTRLALQVATRIQNRMADGVYYVALQGVQPAHLVATIADAVGVFLRGHADPHVQLLHYLSDKELLLVLDSFEHLLVTDIGLLPDILSAAPGVRLLVTSREVLNLQEEWLFPVRGLEIPDDVSVDNLDAYSAVQFFTERARHVRRNFSLAQERAGVVHICQLVEGMPLALELAASWLTTLGCAEIAAEIQRHFSFLSTHLRDIPVRHHSMQAVFDESWNRLAEEEKAALKRLSVFSGGFEREAAGQVAGASLTILSSLVDKSLLRREPDGRYQIHELLRQYAEEQLGASPESVAETRNRHCIYYAEFLHQRLAGIDGQEVFAQEVASELGNVRAAWRWAVEQGNTEAIYKATGTWFYFCQIQGRYKEGETSLAAAARSLEGQAQTPERDRALAQVLGQQGWLCIRLGQLDRARRVLEQSLALYQAPGVAPVPGMGTDPRTALGVVATVQGDYAEATRLDEEARQVAKARDDSWNRMLASYVLAGAALAQGQLEAAGHYAGEGYATAAELNARWFMAYLLNEKGHVARLSGNYGEARQHYETSFAMRQEFGDPEGMAVALNHLGQVALLQADYAEAERLYRRSQAIYREIRDPGGRASRASGEPPVPRATIRRRLGRFVALCRSLMISTSFPSPSRFWLMLASCFSRPAISSLLSSWQLWRLTIRPASGRGRSRRDGFSASAKPNLRSRTLPALSSGAKLPALLRAWQPRWRDWRCWSRILFQSLRHRWTNPSSSP
jgi:predicted ATPase